MGALLLLVLYMVPGIIASSRGHHNQGAIWAVSILLGWTGIGWLVAFIWSLTSPQAYRVPQIIINNSNQLGQPGLANNQSVVTSDGSWYKGNLVENASGLSADEQRVLQQYRQDREVLARLAAASKLPPPEPPKSDGAFLEGVKPMRPFDDDKLPPIDLKGFHP